MRILAGAAILLLAGVSPAFAVQALDERDQLLLDLQRKVEELERKLDQRSEPAPSADLELKLDEVLQQSPVEPFAAGSRLNVSAPANDNLTMSGAFRWRTQWWNDFPTGVAPATDDTILSLEQNLSLGFGFRVSEQSTINAELNDARVWGTDAPTFVAPDNNLELATASLTVTDVYGSGIDLILGRQQIVHGAERHFGDEPWVLQPTRWDGITALTAFDDQTTLGYHGVRLADNDQIFASEFSPGLGGTNADLHALYLTHASGEDAFGTVEAYYIPDRRATRPHLGNAAGKTLFHTYGARWTHGFEGLTWDVEACDAVRRSQRPLATTTTASITSCSPPAVNTNCRTCSSCGAWSLVTTTPPEGATPSCRFAPTTHGWFGLTDSLTWSNVEHYMLGIDFVVSEEASDRLRFEWHWQRLQDGAQGFGGLALAGGATGEKDLGQEWDIIYSVDCTQNSTFDAGLGWFYPGDAFSRATGQNDDIQFAYVQYGLTF